MCYSFSGVSISLSKNYAILTTQALRQVDSPTCHVVRICCDCRADDFGEDAAAEENIGVDLGDIASDATNIVTNAVGGSGEIADFTVNIRPPPRSLDPRTDVPRPRPPPEGPIQDNQALVSPLRPPSAHEQDDSFANAGTISGSNNAGMTMNTTT